MTLPNDRLRAVTGQDLVGLGLMIRRSAKAPGQMIFAEWPMRKKSAAGATLLAAARAPPLRAQDRARGGAQDRASSDLTQPVHCPGTPGPRFRAAAAEATRSHCEWSA